MQASFIHLYNASKTTAEISEVARNYIAAAQTIFTDIRQRWPDAVSTIFELANDKKESFTFVVVQDSHKRTLIYSLRL
jgi:hypothetical protein